MKVLGLGGSNHDFAACLVIDGQVKAAIEEERITRIKHSLGLGLKAVRCRSADYVLEAHGLTIDDVDCIVGNDILDPKFYEKYKDKIHLMNHHLAHACSSYYVSGFNNSAVLVIDGYGSPVQGEEAQNETVSFYWAKDKNIELIHNVSGHLDRQGENPVFENSLGAFYLTLTRGLGFKFLQEGKTMGLAAYGQDTYVDEFFQFYDCSAETGSYKLTREHIRLMDTFMDRILSAASNEQDLFQRKADLAYAGQYHIETAMIKLCLYLYEQTKVDTLCLAGGVALNSVANYKILEHTPFKRIFIQPAAGDAGTAIGSALYGNFIIGDKHWQPLDKPFSPYLGKAYSHDDIEEALNRYKDAITIEKPDDLFGVISQKIAEGNIVGFFHGQSEIGPRALGNRSILADPRNPGMKDTINLRIKHREPFRPFAPIVLEEHQKQYFATDHPSHYMLFVPPIHEAKHEVIPSVTHYDGTGRVQTISQKINPVIHGLLEAFYKETGVPVLLNTSFNDNEEPIVESPMDAVKCFLTIDLDYLVLEEYILRKK